MGEAKTKKGTAPETDAISAEEADKNVILVLEDIRKYKLLQEQLRAKIAEYDVYIAQCELSIADLNRRKAGVMYPPAPVPEPTAGAKTPTMGQPVGGK